MKAFEKIYAIVRHIPSGKVMTYGQVGRLVGTTGRVVGFAMHTNPFSDPLSKNYVPCHRVVDRNGRLAPGFAFGGEKEQKLRLESEGVKLSDERHVDLRKSEYNDRG